MYQRLLPADDAALEDDLRLALRKGYDKFLRQRKETDDKADSAT